MPTPLQIDGSLGEGGGQILRSSLALSIATGLPFSISNIRANRPKPGLLRQHLTAVHAATAISSATVDGASLGSRSLTFSPGPVTPGSYRFAVGTAGSATLVLQTILPPLLTAPAPSHLTLEGGTHNPHAPPYPFLQKSFLPLINQMGPTLTPTLDRAGFYPAGGGRLTLSITPATGVVASATTSHAGAERSAAPDSSRLSTQSSALSTSPLSPLHLTSRGTLTHRSCTAILAGLPDPIARRELSLISRAFDWPPDAFHTLHLPPDQGPGNLLYIELASNNVTEVFSGFGLRGVRAESVADDVLKQAKRYLASGAPVGPCLADQLLLPLALAGSGSFLTTSLTRHSSTNIQIIQAFLPHLRITTTQTTRDQWLVQIG